MVELVTHPEALLKALTRLYKESDGLVLSNIDGTLELMLRCDPDIIPDDSDAMDFEVLIVYDEDTDVSKNFKQLLEREAMTSILDDEDAEFVISDWSVPKSAAANSEEVLRAMRKLNWCYAIKVCPCNNYLIKDASEHDMCVYCQMTATEETSKPGMCVICHEETPICTMKRQKCCKHYVHARCLDRWYSRKESQQCPMCRVIK